VVSCGEDIYVVLWWLWRVVCDDGEVYVVYMVMMVDRVYM